MELTALCATHTWVMMIVLVLTVVRWAKAHVSCSLGVRVLPGERPYLGARLVFASSVRRPR